MLWKKATPNDGPGFSPNVTVTSVATPYKGIWNIIVSEFENNCGEKPPLTLTLIDQL
jgi:hypothetical protein